MAFLTQQQLTALKAVIDADPALASQPNNSDGAFAIAAALNQTASPAWVAWKTSVLQDDIMQNGFDWVRVDNLSVGKARIWEWLFDNESRTFNPSKPNVRLGIDETWKGTAADLAVRAAVYVHCKFNTTRAQKALSSGIGNDATPATLDSNITQDFQLSYDDVDRARNLG